MDVNSVTGFKCLKNYEKAMESNRKKWKDVINQCVSAIHALNHELMFVMNPCSSCYAYHPDIIMAFGIKAFNNARLRGHNWVRNWLRDHNSV